MVRIPSVFSLQQRKFFRAIITRVCSNTNLITSNSLFRSPQFLAFIRNKNRKRMNTTSKASTYKLFMKASLEESFRFSSFALCSHHKQNSKLLPRCHRCLNKFFLLLGCTRIRASCDFSLRKINARRRKGARYVIHCFPVCYSHVQLFSK